MFIIISSTLKAMKVSVGNFFRQREGIIGCKFPSVQKLSELSHRSFPYEPIACFTGRSN